MYEQNTVQWLEMRKGKIGASDAPVIMHGEHFKKTPYILWEEKLGLRDTEANTAHKQRGHDLEDPARLALEQMTGISFRPHVAFHPSIPWMMASLDAIDPENQHIAEIKCPNKEDHQCALAGQIPQKYYPQVQHQLEVCGLEMSYYFSFDGKQGVLVTVHRDDKYIKKLIEKEQHFWECLQNFSPPELTEKDYESQTTLEWELAANEWISIKKQLKEFEQLEKKEKSIRDKLISLSGNRNAMGAGIKLTRFMKKGNVDYINIPEIKNLDLDKYRKPPSECYKLSIV